MIYNARYDTMKERIESSIILYLTNELCEKNILWQLIDFMLYKKILDEVNDLKIGKY